MLSCLKATKNVTNPFMFSSNTATSRTWAANSTHTSVSSSKQHLEQRPSDQPPELQKLLAALGNSVDKVRVRGLETFLFLYRLLYVIKVKTVVLL